MKYLIIILLFLLFSCGDETIVYENELHKYKFSCGYDKTFDGEFDIYNGKAYFTQTSDVEEIANGCYKGNWFYEFCPDYENMTFTAKPTYTEPCSGTLTEIFID